MVDMSGLRVEGVSKGFSRGGQWSAVLRDVSLKVEPGEIVAVVGGTLSGKTTLLKIAAGMEKVDQGSVEVGHWVAYRERAKLLGKEVVWLGRQGPALDVEVSRFVAWLMALDNETEAKPAALRMLDRVGASDCVGRKWAEISNHQRLLVSLARAFACRPRLIVIDDLLDALGSRGTEEVSDLLRSLVEETDAGCGVLMSATEVDAAMYADRLLMLRRGVLKPLVGSPPHTAQVVPIFRSQAI
jgi:iron(III) transport system ATP-binding protein